MATQTLIEYTDDLDGSKGAETLRFGLDGTDYEIDLKGGNAKKFRKAVGPYAAAARRVRQTATRQTTARRTTQTRDRSGEVRRWAREHGYNVGAKGRIPHAVEQAFTAAH
jgi:hypothetical protein